MGNIKLKFNNNFTCVPNVVFEQKSKLSIKSIGLYCFILSRPEDWEFSIEGTCVYLDEGRTIIRNAIDELEEIGLLKCTQFNENGKFGSATWEVFDTVTPSSGFPTSGKPTSQKPTSEKQTQTNTNRNKKTSSTEESKKEEAQAPDEAFLKFTDWQTKNAPNTAKMKEPITPAQLSELKAKYSTETIADVFKAMHNKADLLKKYVSAYLTALEWCKRRDADKSNGNGAKGANNASGSAGGKVLKNLPVFSPENAKYENWYLNNGNHPLWKIADRFGCVDMTKANKMERATGFCDYQHLLLRFPEHMGVEKHRFIEDVFACFADNTFQPLGVSQRFRYDNADLQEKDVTKGIIL